MSCTMGFDVGAIVQMRRTVEEAVRGSENKNFFRKRRRAAGG